MITFLDIEVDENTKKIIDFGCIKENGQIFHDNNEKKFLKFIGKSDFYCGHNIVNHDMKYINRSVHKTVIKKNEVIDTLFMSTLLFPDKPYHKLIKDDKLLPEDSNNPLNDSENSMALFFDEINAFNKLNKNIQIIYYNLLKDIEGFTGFFNYLKFKSNIKDILQIIKQEYFGYICENSFLENLISNYPLELAYSLALIKTEHIESLFPKWVINTYPIVEDVILQLRGTPCDKGCQYCDNHLDAKLNLKRLFNFDEFRDFDGLPLQELAVNTALKNKSLIAVFPTGGGKSLTYQLPALMMGENTRSLTVIISPLQSLMKDQVDNLQSKNINRSAMINGLLDPIERAKNIERVFKGEVSILYIAPESLRSKTIERIMLSRDIARFVIDEAHCFSTWGQDFRVDYLYIADFIKNIQEKKNNNKIIPVSCFTATAKLNVIKDIEGYFMKKLNLPMEKITSASTRKNLKFKVFSVKDESEKYNKLRELIDSKDCPTIIYASRIKTVNNLQDKLSQDQYDVSKFHGKMEVDDKVKAQNKFMAGEIKIMVATSAFGMGVDKKDVGTVIHYEISSSLENYVQEAGRAGRDEHINADCFVLYNEEDLDKHFSLLNNTKLNLKEIQQIWTGIKRTSRANRAVSKSALEIAKDAGWEENIAGLQTRVTTAIAALEDSGYLSRGQNSPRIYANSILSESMIDASKIIESSTIIQEQDKILAKRITQSLISSKYSKRSKNVESESRIDYMADMLGIKLSEVVRIVGLLKEEKILADNKDLACYIKIKSKVNTSLRILDDSNKLERFLINEFTQEECSYNLKELNEKATEENLKSNVKLIKMIINYFNINKYIEIKKVKNNILKIQVNRAKDELFKLIEDKHVLSAFILEFLYKRSEKEQIKETDEYSIVLFSVHELKDSYEKQINMFNTKASIDEIEDSLYYMKIIESIKIEGGFLVIYNPMKITRLEVDNKKRYTKKDYEKLELFYKNKVEQIHIVGEYAKKMLKNYEDALQFVNDYFNIKYEDFLKTHFPGGRAKDIQVQLSPSKFKQLFGELSADQLAIINDKSDKIVVAAGPGSGKTKLLVHKLASVSLMEDIRSDQMLMLTFSRAAVIEFKTRLVSLLGTAAHYIEINTFHSFCFDILGKVGNLEHTDKVIDQAIELIDNDEVDSTRITKMILVVDEAQDMVENEYRLILKLIEKNENLRIIAVGDDDQNIYEFRGSSNEYLKQLMEDATFYELPQNYRSKKNLIDFTNEFVTCISGRMKVTPIIPVQKEDGLIRVIQHIAPNNLYEPVVKHIAKSDLSGTTCILTRTNEQASIITGMLNIIGIKAQLIQENSEFNLFSLFEFREFINLLSQNETLSVISNDLWLKTKKDFLVAKKDNMHYDVLSKALDTFELLNHKIKYMSDLYEFLKESSYDDFVTCKQLLVSTLHKSKGREFDNVIILFDNEFDLKNRDKRLLYVGMTRAKTNLLIHYSSDYLRFNDISNSEYYVDKNDYELPNELTFTLTHKEVNLGYFKFTQKSVESIDIGAALTLIDNGRLIHDNSKILQFSKKYKEDIEKLLEQGYVFDGAIVKYKLYWYNPDIEEELVIILPELKFAKKPI
ncbi:RecQ family ATP-dependent DNA helicase [Mariniplasma anaerobium]|uniref:DNA 3'-5' helicase n=1 Tax=Mariniplasma anaerobium TaxID=2735436 RepID=A0A7U9THY9_9MOLU|nr:RecQ family ATP-dependent DNA helicase [Mariniplasma anaerobium]BCR35203.1 hypothetical protein MPAN_000960 [Mariniplasma anaerobium]